MTKHLPETLRAPAAVALTALAALALPVSLSAAGGSSAPSLPTPSRPEATAADHYNRGLKYRDKAWSYEEKAAAAAGAQAEKLLKKARKEYEKAIRAQEEALKLEPGAYQALSSLGYALRKTGRFDESIGAYNRALSLQPSYAEAIEYRAEAFLGLDRLDDAKEAYMHLFRADREKADELLGAMQAWVNEKRTGEGSAEVEDFAAWVAERTQLADQTAMLSGAGRDW